MDKSVTLPQIKLLCQEYKYESAFMRAILAVESSGIGFSRLPPFKIIIRFEPSWFKREYKHWADEKDTTWLNTGVQNQHDEWRAFDTAFAENPTAAMLSTSIGMMQLMGFHYAELGFKTVGEFWDYCKVSEINQIECGFKWIKSVPKLDQSVRTVNAGQFAYYYNGQDFMEIAAKNNEPNYANRIVANRTRFLQLEQKGG